MKENLKPFFVKLVAIFDKEKIFSDEDKILIYKFFKKIQKEFEDLELEK